MANTVTDLNIDNGLTVEDITTTTITADSMTSNTGLFNSLRTTNLYCKNVELDISQNLNLSGSISSLNMSTNVLSCNSINTNLINRTSDGSRYATIKDISDCYDSIIDGAPGALNTLKEIASSINNEVSFSTMIFGRLGNIDNSYNNIIQPVLGKHDTSLNNLNTTLNTSVTRITNHDTSLNTLNTSVNNLTTTVNGKISNEINQDVFLTGNLYIKPTNKFITFLNSFNNTMGSIITKSDYTTFTNVSSLVSGGWNFVADTTPKLNINNNGDIAMNGSINSNGSITCNGIVTCAETIAGKLTFPNVTPINHIQRGIVTPSINGNYRVQFSKVFPSAPSVTASPVYAGLNYNISVIISAVDTSGFNFNVFINTITSSQITVQRFEQNCQVSWIAIG